MAVLSSTLAWKIPWMEEPGRLQSMGSQRVIQDWATSLSFSLSYLTLSPTFTHRTINTNLQCRQCNRIHRSIRYKNLLSQRKNFKLKIKCLYSKRCPSYAHHRVCFPSGSFILGPRHVLSLASPLVSVYHSLRSD